MAGRRWVRPLPPPRRTPPTCTRALRAVTGARRSRRWSRPSSPAASPTRRLDRRDDRRGSLHLDWPSGHGRARAHGRAVGPPAPHLAVVRGASADGRCRPGAGPLSVGRRTADAVPLDPRCGPSPRARVRSCPPADAGAGDGARGPPRLDVDGRGRATPPPAHRGPGRAGVLRPPRPHPPRPAWPCHVSRETTPPLQKRPQLPARRGAPARPPVRCGGCEPGPRVRVRHVQPGPTPVRAARFT